MMRIFYIIILIFTSHAYAEDSLPRNESLSSAEQYNLSSDLREVEKANNQKYRNPSSAQIFMDLYANLSRAFSSSFSTENLNQHGFPTNALNKYSQSKPASLPIDSPRLETSDSEIYSQKIYFKSAFWKQKYSNRKSVRIRKKPKPQDSFASSLKYTL